MAESGADFNGLYQDSFDANDEATKDIKKGYAGIHSTGFQDLLLKPELNRAIAECGFEHPSEVQHKCLPVALLGNDLICQAKSGMGKTAVFVLSVLNSINTSESHISALVLCHTRELAHQIKQEFDRFSKHLDNVHTEAIYGGVNLSAQKKTLKEKDVRIVVGSPGRVNHLIRDKALDLSNLNHFILDECDKLLDENKMRSQVQDIFRHVDNKMTQVMMFTATLNDEVKETALKFMKNPEEIYVDSGSKLTLHGLHQYYVNIEEKGKINKLKDILDTVDFNQTVIFVKRTNYAAVLSQHLEESGFPCSCIHGDMPQPERIERYNEFKKFQSRVLVSTDVFARGIDIERVNVVVNFHMPDSADTYLHRVGRAGRFGTKGLAISFVTTEEDKQVLEEVQKRFVVQIPEMPASIEPSLYKNS